MNAVELLYRETFIGLCGKYIKKLTGREIKNAWDFDNFRAIYETLCDINQWQLEGLPRLSAESQVQRWYVPCSYASESSGSRIENFEEKK